VSFRSIYESHWYHPVFFWVAGVAFFIWFARRFPFLHAYIVVFTIEILADALLTSDWSPVKEQFKLPVAIGFVVLGDLRYFLLVERARSGALGVRAVAIAIGLSFVVPLLSYVPQIVVPSAFADQRVAFITYEAMFVALAIVVLVWLWRGAFADADQKRWAMRVTYFEIVQYGLWAAADAVILRGIDAGYALRLVPNTMYYVFFLPFVAWSMPRELAER
jgi:hypothetical protein